MVRLPALAIACGIAAWGSVASGAELVIFSNGFQMEVERHQTDGDTLKLFTRTGGVIEMAAARVREIVPDDGPPRLPEEPASQQQQQTPAPAAAAGANRLAGRDPKQLLDQAAERYGVPAAFLHSVARAESAYQINALSPKGAIGVMQLMPATAAELGANPHDPAENIDAGARHLRDLLERYDGSAHKALSAYNAGAGAVERYRGIPPYRETVNYVDKVLRTYQSLSAKSK